MQTNATAVQERYAHRVKARLERPHITITDARDGIVDCFIATYFQGVSMGLRSMVGIDGSDDDVARVTAAMFRRRLREHGASFEAPTVDALTAVKDEVDRELHLTELPAEIRGVHDQVCALLLAKADGALPHRPGRSSVEAAGTGAPPAHAPTAPTATAPAPTATAPSPTAPTQASTTPRPPSPPTASPAPLGPPPRVATPPSTRASAAEELARVLERHLIEVGREAAAGAPTSAVRARLAQAEALLVAIDAFASR